MPDFPPRLARLPDPRKSDRVYYPKQTLIWSPLLMFLLGLESRRQFRLESQSQTFVENLNTLAGFRLESAPYDGTFVYYLKQVEPDRTAALALYPVEHLIRMKVLDPWRLHERFLVAVDMTRHLLFRERHCAHCLTQKGPDGRTVYFHYVLEAKLVTGNGMVFTMASEFIENFDPKADKQDCERKAFPRLAAKLKAAFPRLGIILLADSLYACAPVFEICQKNHWGFIFTFKEGSIPTLFDEFQRLRLQAPENRATFRNSEVSQFFSWVNDLKHEGHTVNVFDCHETPREGNSRYFAWITNFTVACASVITLANQGGRLRWKIENEGFDIQKNHGYALEHAYATNEWAVKNFYFLLQVAHAINQLMVKGALRREFGQYVGSLKNFLRRLAESFRQSLITPALLDPAIPLLIQIRFDTS